MSLIYNIKTRRFEDLINQGLRLALTDSTSNAVVDGVVMAGGQERNFVITGWVLSTNSATDIKVTLGFKVAGQSTSTFATAYIKSGSSISMDYQLGDERYSDSAASIVITADGGPVAYTINGRLLADKVGIGYIYNTAVTRL